MHMHTHATQHTRPPLTHPPTHPHPDPHTPHAQQAGVEYTPRGDLVTTSDTAAARAVAAGTWRNEAARLVLRDGFGMPLVATYNTSVHFWNVHSHNYKGLECRCAPRAGADGCTQNIDG